MRTVVLQSFRSTTDPPWMGRCLSSVRSWAALRGFDYAFLDDAIFDLCGPDYLARVGDNKRSITNLARLEWTKRKHQDGYDRVIWIDADVFVFAPERLTIEVTSRYAFARQSWIKIDGNGRIEATAAVNNAAFVFMAGEPDLDLFIAITRHIAMHRQITSNYQVGIAIMNGLRYPLGFETLENIGMFSPPVIKAISRKAISRADVRVIREQAVSFGSPVFAANLCYSHENLMLEAELRQAMDFLEKTAGDVINGHLAAAKKAKQASRLLRRWRKRRS